jgi:hypothetical protein
MNSKVNDQCYRVIIVIVNDLLSYLLDQKMLGKQLTKLRIIDSEIFNLNLFYQVNFGLRDVETLMCQHIVSNVNVNILTKSTIQI